MAKLSDNDLFENVFIDFCRIIYYTKNVSEEKLLKDIKTQDALFCCSQRIGKNVSRISEKYRRNNFELKMVDWEFLATFEMDNFFSVDDMWDVLHSDENGLIRFFFPKIRKTYEKNQAVGEEDVKQQNHSKKGDLDLYTCYKYPVHTRASLWAVKKR